MAGHAFRDGTHEHPLEGSEPAASNHDEIGLFGVRGFENGLHGRAPHHDSPGLVATLRQQRGRFFRELLRVFLHFGVRSHVCYFAIKSFAPV